jgi:hypothetical protein
MGRNGQAVNEYLAANVGIKSRIDSLSEQIQLLIDEYETLKNGAQTSALPLS